MVALKRWSLRQVWLNQGLENVHGFDKVRKETELKKNIKSHMQSMIINIVFTDVKSIT